MPWKETCAMNERMRFVLALFDGSETMSELCRRFGTSRKTGHKWRDRYLSDGLAGLADRSRAPHSNPRSIPRVTIEAALSVRDCHPCWGPRKIKAWLEMHEPDRVWPSASTLGAAFDRAGLTVLRKRRRRTPPYTQPFASCTGPNDIWCMDFKGWFLTGDGTHVEPLTVSDAHSRYLLCCQALGRTDEKHVWPVLAALFREHGLPRALRSDNGAPFASRAAGGLSRLSVKLIKAGIAPERIEPGKPQQNGRHERMHLTLKQEIASPPARSLGGQIARLERFREVFNKDRPHEALGQVPPARVYTPSPRRFDGILRSPDYPGTAKVRRVRSNGEIKWRGDLVFLSEVLVREPVGLFEIDNDTWLVKYGPVELGTMRGRAGFQRRGSATRSAPSPYTKTQ